MNHEIESNVDTFNRDITINSGYLYTTKAQLSSQMANRRLSDATLGIADFRDKRVLDIGCGDGTYTLELFERGKPASIHGVDLAQEAIKIAQEKVDNRNISFAVSSAYQLPYGANSFDIAYLRGVLHHMDRPIDALREALRVAPTIVVIEPNGYNPILKLLERFSPYHVEHEEKSYTSVKLDSWVKELKGNVTQRQWVGLVPMFCPDWFARSLKTIEPLVEGLPLLNTLGCAVYVFVATRSE